MVTKTSEDLSVRIPLTKEEKEKFDAFVEDKNLNVRRFVRKLIIEAVNKDAN